MYQQVFKDLDLNERIKGEGFVVLNDFLSIEKTEALRNIYYNTGDASCKNAFTTFVADNIDYKKQIDRDTKSVFAPLFAEYFNGFIPYWGNYFCKKPGGMQMPLHADWQYVDEQSNISINIWCPLTETNEANGAFGVVPYSHLAVNQPRGMNLYQFYLQYGNTILRQFGKTLPLKPGAAVIYDHRLLHYSVPNHSTNERLAVTMIGVPEGVEIIHYASDYEGGNVLKYVLKSADDLFHLKFKSLPENLNPVAQLGKLTFEELTPESVERVLRTASGTVQQVADTKS